MKKIAAILATLVTLLSFFVIPVAHRWYVKTYFPGENSLGPFLPFMGTMALLIVMVALCVYLWNELLKPNQ